MIETLKAVVVVLPNGGWVLLVPPGVLGLMLAALDSGYGDQRIFIRHQKTNPYGLM